MRRSIIQARTGEPPRRSGEPGVAACGRRGAEARPMPANSEGVIEDPEEESESSSEETRPNELLMAGGTSSEPGGDASALAGEAGFGVGFCGLAFFGLFCGLSAFTAGLRALTFGLAFLIAGAFLPPYLLWVLSPWKLRAIHPRAHL